jgi:hypothetical protein
MNERQRDEQRTEEQADERPEALEDLDVNEAHADEVKGGNKTTPVATYSIVNAWPKKYSG